MSDRDEVLHIAALYCHALDRRAWHLLERCFHPDATYRFGPIDGTWQDFVAAARAILEPLAGTHHQLGQTLLSINGDAAGAESYFTAVHRVPASAPGDAAFPGTGAAYEVLIGGRYVDRLERRAGEWRIAHRTGLHDWRHDRPAADAGFDVLPAAWRGAMDESDPGREVSAAWTNPTTSNSG